MLAGGGRVCVGTSGSWSYLRERLCSQSRVCVPTRGTTTRPRSPLSSQELTLAACLAIGGLLGATPREISVVIKRSWRGASELRGCECEMLRVMRLLRRASSSVFFAWTRLLLSGAEGIGL